MHRRVRVIRFPSGAAHAFFFFALMKPDANRKNTKNEKLFFCCKKKTDFVVFFFQKKSHPFFLCDSYVCKKKSPKKHVCFLSCFFLGGGGWCITRCIVIKKKCLHASFLFFIYGEVRCDAAAILHAVRQTPTHLLFLLFLVIWCCFCPVRFRQQIVFVW